VSKNEVFLIKSELNEPITKKVNIVKDALDAAKFELAIP